MAEKEAVFLPQEKILGSLLSWPCFEMQCWPRWYPEVPSNLTHSVTPYQGVGVISQEKELWTSNDQAFEKCSQREHFTACSSQDHQIMQVESFLHTETLLFFHSLIYQFSGAGFLRCFHSVCTTKCQKFIWDLIKLQIAYIKLAREKWTPKEQQSYDALFPL